MRASKLSQKIALKIERFREAPAGGEIRTFQWLWQSMIDCIDESQHDHNTASILNALKSKVDAAAAGVEKEKKKEKKERKDEKEKSESSHQKNSVDVAAASSSKAPPKAKATPKPKPFSSSQAEGKGGGKDKKTLLPVKRVVQASFTQAALVGGIHVRSFMIHPQSLSRRPSPKLVQVSLPHLQSLQETCHQQKL